VGVDDLADEVLEEDLVDDLVDDDECHEVDELEIKSKVIKSKNLYLKILVEFDVYIVYNYIVFYSLLRYFNEKNTINYYCYSIDTRALVDK